MSYLLFMDESGHDHRQMPYEVRGGVAIHARDLWRFVQQMRATEKWCFGDYLHQYGSELKGSKLLQKKRFEWADQADWMDDSVRQQHARRFLQRGINDQAPRSEEFAAYGQACIEMARKTFDLLKTIDARLFAAAIPRGVLPEVDDYRREFFLRKDHVFLFERYFYFLSDRKDYGLIVMDETEKQQDRDFTRRMERYFTDTTTGNHRRSLIVPYPLFVSSDLSYPVQAADVVIYTVNWGFRLPQFGMDGETRDEIAKEFGWRLNELQYSNNEVEKAGETFSTYGIVYVDDPYTSRE